MGWIPTIYDKVETVTKAEADVYEANRQPQYEERFRAATEGLPIKLIYGLGPHSMPILEDVMALVRPKVILEIGFGAGASSSLFLALNPLVRLVSVDSTDDPRIHEAVQMQARRHSGRFEFVHSLSSEVAPALAGRWFDLAFIDGDHTIDGVRGDLAVAKALGIPVVLLDDWWPHYGPGVQPAVREADWLSPWKQWGNLMLMRRRTAPRKVGGNVGVRTTA
jgi:hypothetical protein